MKALYFALADDIEENGEAEDDDDDEDDPIPYL